MTPEEYIKSRLDDQIGWYGRKSTSNKRALLWLRILEITAAALVPFLAGYVKPEAPVIIFVVGALGVFIAISAACAVLFQFQENWIKYRTTAESLKKEKYMFLTKVEPYDSPDDAFSMLVHRVETLVSKENSNWAQYMMKQGEDQGHGH